jgi:hypothetical protein
MPADESRFLRKLEAEVETELGMARSSRPEDALGPSPADCVIQRDHGVPTATLEAARRPL